MERIDSVPREGAVRVGSGFFWLATEATEALYTPAIFRQLFDSLVTVLGAGD